MLSVDDANRNENKLSKNDMCTGNRQIMRNDKEKMYKYRNRERTAKSIALVVRAVCVFPSVRERAYKSEQAGAR